MNDKKTTYITLGLGIILALGVGSMIALGGSKEQAQNTDIVARSGIHAHPKVTISIKGQPQTVPAGIGANDDRIHTHDTTGEVHWELPGVVRQQDMKLGEFFKTWNQAFSATTLMGQQNGVEGTVKMTVNGQPNSEFENYYVKDKDVIDIRYE